MKLTSGWPVARSVRPSPAAIRIALSEYGEDELLEELVRRKNAREKERKPDRWCDACANFKVWGHENLDKMPDDYNPCTKRHKMNFWLPAHETDDDHGFYRRVCADRKDHAS